MFYSDGCINKTEELGFITWDTIILKCAFQNKQISKMIGQNKLTLIHIMKINLRLHVCINNKILQCQF